MEQLKFKIGTIRNPILIDFKEFNKQKLVDIRKYFFSKEEPEVLLPTKKGVSLNSVQLSQLIEVLNINSSDISDFFELKVENKIDIKIQPTIGRSFQLKYENNKIVLLMDDYLSDKLKEDQLQIFANLLKEFYKALFDVLEHQDEIEIIMDILNKRIVRIL